MGVKGSACLGGREFTGIGCLGGRECTGIACLGGIAATGLGGIAVTGLGGVVAVGLGFGDIDLGGGVEATGLGFGTDGGSPCGKGRGRGDAITGDLDVTKGSNPHTCGKLKMVKKGSRSAYPWNTNARRMHSTVSTVSSHTIYSMKQRTQHYSLCERILRNIGANRKEQHLPRKQSAISRIDHLDQSLLVLFHRRGVSLKNDEGEVGLANARSYL